MCASTFIFLFIVSSFGKGFTAQCHQTSFHPNIVVSRLPHGFYGESQYISLSFIYLLYVFFLFFYFSALLQIKDASTSNHSTSVTIMCEDHDYISPEHKAFDKNRYIVRYYKCAQVTIIDIR